LCSLAKPAISKVEGRFGATERGGTQTGLRSKISQ
jgi:hypothetical protein